MQDGIVSRISQALIHASHSSLASQLSPELIAESVKRGIWPFKQALLITRQIPKRSLQLDALAALISLAPEFERQALVHEILAKVADHEHPWSLNIEALAAAIAENGFPGDALHLARTFAGNDWLPGALTKIALHLTDPLKTQVLLEAIEGVRRLDSAFFRSANFADIVPQLPEWRRSEVALEGLEAAWQMNPQERKGFGAVVRVRSAGRFLPLLAAPVRDATVQRLLREIQDMHDPVHRSRAVADSVDFLPPERRSAVLNQALTDTRSITDAKDRAWQLGWLIRKLDEPLQSSVLEEALQSARQIRLQDERLKAVAHLAPLFSESLARKTAIELKRGLQGWAGGWLLMELAMRLFALGRHEDAFDIALAIQDEHRRRSTLADLRQGLPTALLQSALSPSRIGDDDERRRTLIGLAAYLDRSYQQEALELMSGLPDGNSSRYAKVSAVQDMVDTLDPSLLIPLVQHISTFPEDTQAPSPRLAGLRALLSRQESSDFISEAVALALSFKRGELRVQAISCLLPHTSDSLRRTLLDEALNGLARIKRLGDYVYALSQLAVQCEEPMKAQVVREALDAVAKIPGAYDRAKGLTHIGPLLQPETIDRALSIAKQIQDGDPCGVAAVAPHLEEPARTAEVRQILHRAAEARMYVGLDTAMAVITESLVPEAIAVLYKANRSWTLWSSAASTLATRVAVLGHFETALDIVERLSDSETRAEVVEALAPAMPQALIGRIIDLADQTPNELAARARARILAAIAPRLSDEDGDRVMLEAADIICRVDGEDVRMHLWTKIVPPLLMVNTATLHRILTGIWERPGPRTRAEVLNDVYSLRRVLLKLGGPVGLSETYEAIREVTARTP